MKPKPVLYTGFFCYSIRLNSIEQDWHGILFVGDNGLLICLISIRNFCILGTETSDRSNLMVVRGFLVFHPVGSGCPGLPFSAPGF